MQCPECSKEIKKEKSHDGSTVFRCRECGWGAPLPESPLPPEPEAHELVHDANPSIPASAWIKLPFFILISSVIVLGPYLFVVYGMPWAAENNGYGLSSKSPAEIADDLNPTYWYFVIGYLGLAEIFASTRVSGEMGLFGTWWDNPFSYEDDFNRSLAVFLFLLLPGKFVNSTFKGICTIIYRLISGKGGEPKSQGRRRSKSYRSRRG